MWADSGVDFHVSPQAAWSSERLATQLARVLHLARVHRFVTAQVPPLPETFPTVRADVRLLIRVDSLMDPEILGAGELLVAV